MRLLTMSLLTMSLPALLGATPAGAQAITLDQRAALDARVAEFGAAMTGNDVGELFAFAPPVLRATLAKLSGMTEAQLVEALPAAMEAAGGMEALDNFAMDTNAATVAETPDGSRTYALIPTTVDVTAEGQTMRATSETLAFEDAGEWWFVRIDDPGQAQVLSRAYPEFAGVTFPAGAMTPVQ